MTDKWSQQYIDDVDDLWGLTTSSSLRTSKYTSTYKITFVTIIHFVITIAHSCDDNNIDTKQY